MKITLKIFAILLLILSISDSCTKDLANYPEYNPKLVISGFLSPDEEIHYISVRFNQAIFVGPHEPFNISNITATISDDQNEIQLRPIFEQFLNILTTPDSLVAGFVFNSSEFPVEAGKTYNLKVYAENGQYAESSCSVPLKRKLSPKLDTITVPYQNYPEYSYLQSDFSFTDIAGEENFYALFGEIIMYRSAIRPVRPEYINLVDEKYSFLNDKAFDGERIKIHLNDINSIDHSDSAFLKIYLLNTDKPYYDYHKSIVNYVSGEIPFTEASPVYSNIKGGFGIFASYTCDSIIIRLK